MLLVFCLQTSAVQSIWDYHSVFQSWKQVHKKKKKAAVIHSRTLHLQLIMLCELHMTIWRILAGLWGTAWATCPSGLWRVSMSALDGSSAAYFCWRLVHELKELQKIFALDHLCTKRQSLFSTLKMWPANSRPSSFREQVFPAFIVARLVSCEWWKSLDFFF